MRSLALTLACVAIAGCSIIPHRPAYALDCGQMARSECEVYAARMVTLAEGRHPGRRVDSFVITAPNGSYEITFADGTMEAVDID